MTPPAPPQRESIKILPEIALAIAELHLSYPDRADVLQNINLQVRTGDRVGLIGHNGCGKTTLFTSICGLLTPDRGEIRLFNRPMIPGQFYPEIGYLFQNPSDQLFSATTRDDIAFGPQNMGLSPAEIEARVREAIAACGIESLLERPPHHLSGGEKQMVAIAGILALRPKIVLYDEPTASLDLRARRRLIRFLHHAPETMLFAAHDLEFILETCDRVLVMENGRIVAEGVCREVLRDRDLMETHGLETPYSLR